MNGMNTPSIQGKDFLSCLGNAWMRRLSAHPAKSCECSLATLSVFLSHHQESDHGNDYAEQPHPVFFQEAGCCSCRRQRGNHDSGGGFLRCGYCCRCFLFHDWCRSRCGLDRSGFGRCGLDNFLLGLLHCRLGCGLFCHRRPCWRGLLDNGYRSRGRCRLRRRCNYGSRCRCRFGDRCFLFGCASRDNER